MNDVKNKFESANNGSAVFGRVGDYVYEILLGIRDETVKLADIKEPTGAYSQHIKQFETYFSAIANDSLKSHIPVAQDPKSREFFLSVLGYAADAAKFNGDSSRTVLQQALLECPKCIVRTLKEIVAQFPLPVQESLNETVFGQPDIKKLLDKWEIEANKNNPSPGP